MRHSVEVSMEPFTVVVLSREEAEKVKPLPNSAIISITDPGSDDANLKDGWEYILRQKFSDVSPSTLSDYQNEGMSKQQAEEAVQFIALVADSADVLYIHCEAGISRSAGVASFVQDTYQVPVEGGLSLHNRWVYRRLWRAKYAQEIEDAGWQD